jgi:SH3-like domain-containing protein
MQGRQPAEIAESQSPATPSESGPQSAGTPAAQPQDAHAPGLGSSSTSAPPIPQGQLAPGISMQQVQSTSSAQQQGDASASQGKTNPSPATQQAQSTPQSKPDQSASADQEPAAEAQQQEQSGGDWVKVSRGGATVRSGPSSSASRLIDLRSGMEVRVVARQSGWVEIANADGSQTGWVYEKLLEPTGAPSGDSAGASEPAEATSPTQPEQSQSGWVKVLGSPAGMRASPSDSSPILFAFPEGRELRVVSRQLGWVQVKDPGSKQTGWVAETSLIASNGHTKEQQTASPPAQRQQAAGASPQWRQSVPQRPSRDAGPGTHENAEGPPPRARGGWVPSQEEAGPSAVAEDQQDRPRRWWRRRGGFTFFRGDPGEE